MKTKVNARQARREQGSRQERKRDRNRRFQENKAASKKK